MRFVLKIFAAPFVLALSLAVGVLSFVFSLASWAFSILSLLRSSEAAADHSRRFSLGKEEYPRPQPT